MVVEYKYNPKNSLNLIFKLKWYYLQNVLLILLFLFLLNDLNATLIFAGILSIPILLQVVLHLNYYFEDKDSLLTIDYVNKTISLKNNSITTSVAFDDISEMIYYKGGKNQDLWGKYTIPSNFYNYTMIKNNKDEKIIFTDFILRDLNLSIIKKKITTRPFLNLT